MTKILCHFKLLPPTHSITCAVHSMNTAHLYPFHLVLSKTIRVSSDINLPEEIYFSVLRVTMCSAPLLTPVVFVPSQLAAVHLVDSHYCADPAKFISVLCTSLSTMLHVELPHVNILSKMDLIEQYGKLGESGGLG